MRAYNAEASNPCVPQRMDRKAEEWGRKENAHALPPRTMMSPATAARNMGRIFCPPGKIFDCERVTTLSSQTAGQRAGSVHPPIPFSSSLKTHWKNKTFSLPKVGQTVNPLSGIGHGLGLHLCAANGRRRLDGG